MSDGIRILHVKPNDVVVFSNIGPHSHQQAMDLSDALRAVNIKAIIFAEDADIALLNAAQIEELKSNHAETLSRTAGQQPDQSGDALLGSEPGRSEQ